MPWPVSTAPRCSLLAFTNALGTMSKAAGLGGRSAAPCPATRPTSVTQLLLDLSLARLLLATLEVALGPITAALGPWRLACRLFLALRRLLLRSIGYLAAPAQHTALRQLGGGGLDVRRWHVAAGERTDDARCS